MKLGYDKKAWFTATPIDWSIISGFPCQAQCYLCLFLPHVHFKHLESVDSTTAVGPATFEKGVSCNQLLLLESGTWIQLDTWIHQLVFRKQRKHVPAEFDPLAGAQIDDLSGIVGQGLQAQHAPKAVGSLYKQRVEKPVIAVYISASSYNCIIQRAITYMCQTEQTSNHNNEHDVSDVSLVLSDKSIN